MQTQQEEEKKTEELKPQTEEGSQTWEISLPLVIAAFHPSQGVESKREEGEENG